MNLKDKIIKRTDKSISRGRYKTTSFTLLKEDYAAFIAACKKSNRTASVILREMVMIFIEESK